MKRRIKVFVGVLLMLNGYLFSQAYTAHEWGTFTCLFDSKGERLSGLEQEEHALPRFVHQHNWETHSYFSDGTEGYDYEKLNADPNLIPTKAGWVRTGDYLRNVTVKMETPVVYFYAKNNKPFNVQVQVDFPRGSICQWFPERTRGEQVPRTSIINFAEPFGGHIAWDTKVLPYTTSEQEALAWGKDKNLRQQLSIYSDDMYRKANAIWEAPRKTKSNLVKTIVNGKESNAEKYLFYRGLAGFDVPIQVKYINSNTLEIGNTSSQLDFSFVMVYEKKENGQGYIHWSGPLGKNEDKKVSLNDNKQLGIKTFEEQLMKNGLYRDEARAMLETWHESYFQRPGVRVFWIVPRTLVDEILPISFSPAPMELERVFVGRCDVLSPEFEKELRANSEELSQKYRNDRYYVAYKNWLKK